MVKSPGNLISLEGYENCVCYQTIIRGRIKCESAKLTAYEVRSENEI